MAYPQYAIGTSNPPTPFGQYSPPIPWPLRSVPEAFAINLQRGDGTIAGHGFPYTILTFDFLEQAELDHLLGLLTVGGVLRKSRSGIYLKTRKPDDHDEFATYTAVMILPDKLADYRQQSGLYVNVPFEFRRLEAV